MKNSIASHGHSFQEVVPLAIEVSWPSGKPRLLKIPLDYSLLRQLPSIGLAIRAGAYPGKLDEPNGPGPLLAELAAALVQEAVTHHLALREVQLDFDCPERKLAEYEVVARAVKRAIHPLPLALTALPSWLSHRAFAKLAGATDGYILQVHSWSPPADSLRTLTLCDPEAAMRAVRRAAQLGFPFRVALPTYGYMAGFSPAGKLIGLSAEGPNPSWPQDTHLRDVFADPDAMAALVRSWNERRPAQLQAIIWFRLPVETDKLNRSWATFQAVADGRAPHRQLDVKMHRTQPELTEVVLSNAGERDLRQVELVLSWNDQNSPWVAGDALGGLEWIDNNHGQIILRTKGPGFRLRPNEQRTVAWIRLKSPTPLHCEIHPSY